MKDLFGFSKGTTLPKSPPSSRSVNRVPIWTTTVLLSDGVVGVVIMVTVTDGNGLDRTLANR